MTILRILEFPDPKLRIKAVPVETVDDGLRVIIDNMFETMYAAPGIGLAATQVDFHRRLLVVDVSSEKDDPYVLINPKILEKDGSKVSEEGCLSVPGYFDSVKRAETIRVSFLDRDGNQQEQEMTGMLAICVQHEIDHLDGKLFVDYLSETKRQKVRKKLHKQRRVQSDSSMVL
jgi:peptide deformylase|tara:strand:- start:19558 stop:20079 length:522 start_codon:yes stop_codon:yes gene_type:complete